uniref:Uncharacterized protein n=1 Tax=Cacopsylla melanoneura TaxID=428564 RepID=A0A8D8ZPE2_9HEMI
MYICKNNFKQIKHYFLFYYILHLKCIFSTNKKKKKKKKTIRKNDKKKRKKEKNKTKRKLSRYLYYLLFLFLLQFSFGVASEKLKFFSVLYSVCRDTFPPYLTYLSVRAEILSRPHLRYR